MGDEYPNPERRAILEALAEQVRTVADARRILSEQKLPAAPPSQERFVFYFGLGRQGAEELTSGRGFTRLEQTEAGYFLDRATAVLERRGLIPRGSPENVALFGDRGSLPPTYGLWGEVSERYAAAARGPTFLFEDQTFSPERLRQTVAMNVEIPTLNANVLVPSITAYHFDQDTRKYQAVIPGFIQNTTAYGLDETLLAKLTKPSPQEQLQLLDRSAMIQRGAEPEKVAAGKILTDQEARELPPAATKQDLARSPSAHGAASTNEPGTVRYQDRDCTVVVDAPRGSAAPTFRLHEVQTGKEVTKITTTAAHRDPAPGCIHVLNHGEQAGLADALEKSGGFERGRNLLGGMIVEMKVKDPALQPHVERQEQAQAKAREAKPAKEMRRSRGPTLERD